MSLVFIAKAEVTDVNGSNFDFDNIPQTYKDLLFICHARNKSANYGGFFMKANGSSVSTNVDAIRLGYGSNWANNTSKEIAWIHSGQVSNGFAGSRVYIPQYADSGKHKTALIMAQGDSANSGTSHITGWDWGVNAAITRMEFGTFDGGFPNDIFARYSRISLYGIA